MKAKHNLKLDWWANTQISENDVTMTVKGPFLHQVYAWEACLNKHNAPFVNSIVWCTIVKKTENNTESIVDSLFTDETCFPCDIPVRNRSYEVYN